VVTIITITRGTEIVTMIAIVITDTGVVIEAETEVQTEAEIGVEIGTETKKKLETEAEIEAEIGAKVETKAQLLKGKAPMLNPSHTGTTAPKRA